MVRISAPIMPHKWDAESPLLYGRQDTAQRFIQRGCSEEAIAKALYPEGPSQRSIIRQAKVAVLGLVQMLPGLGPVLALFNFGVIARQKSIASGRLPLDAEASFLTSQVRTRYSQGKGYAKNRAVFAGLLVVATAVTSSVGMPISAIGGAYVVYRGIGGVKKKLAGTKSVDRMNLALNIVKRYNQNHKDAVAIVKSLGINSDGNKPLTQKELLKVYNLLKINPSRFKYFA